MNTLRRRVRALWVLALIFLASCELNPFNTSRTAVLLEIHVDRSFFDCNSPQGLRRIQVVLRDSRQPAGAPLEVFPPYPLCLSDRAPQLPILIDIAPGSPDSLTRVWAEVEGYTSADLPVVRQNAIFGFIPRRTGVVRMYLTRNCVPLVETCNDRTGRVTCDPELGRCGSSARESIPVERAADAGLDADVMFASTRDAAGADGTNGADGDMDGSVDGGGGGADVAGSVDGSAANLGCGASFESDPNNCGECGRVCRMEAGFAWRCQRGECVLQCPNGRGDCDGDATPGCETALDTSEHCGACGLRCAAGRRCEAGVCVGEGCGPGADLCGPAGMRSCVNVTLTSAHCGACDNRCSGSCGNGRCLLPARATRFDGGSGSFHLFTMEDGTLQSTNCSSGDQRSVPGPPEMAGTGRVRHVTAGYGYTCALRDDGTVWCWGVGDSGQLGDGVGVSSGSPSQVVTDRGSPLTNIVEIATGYVHACARDRAGQVWCWGGTEIEYGQTGQTGGSRFAIAVRDVRGARGIAAGPWTSCAWGDRGLRCWGRFTNGLLGDRVGDNRSSATPSEVGPLRDRSVVHLAVGDSHACAVLREANDGGPEGHSVWCWGAHASGSLGISESLVGTYEPRPVSGIPGGLTFRDIQINRFEDSDHPGATSVLANDGQVWSWGYLALGQSSTITLLPARASLPIMLAPSDRIVSVSRGGRANGNLLVTAEGHVWCGSNNAAYTELRWP